METFNLEKSEAVKHNKAQKTKLKTMAQKAGSF